MAWTKEQSEVVRRNRAILARNRCFAEHAEWLGLDPTPMELEPIPLLAREQMES